MDSPRCTPSRADGTSGYEPSTQSSRSSPLVDPLSEPRLVLLQLFYSSLVGHRAGPRNEHSKARTPGPTEAYNVRYVAGSALGASNTARRS